MEGLLWGGVAVSLCFVLFRGYVRLRLFRHLFADDILVLSAWLMLFANAIVWQVGAGAMYELTAISNGSMPSPPPDIISQFILFLHLQIPVSLLNICGIWAVKLSFMCFFKKLGHNVKGQKWLWRGVLLAVITAFAICIGVTYWPCLVSSLSYELGK